MLVVRYRRFARGACEQIFMIGNVHMRILNAHYAIFGNKVKVVKTFYEHLIHIYKG